MSDSDLPSKIEQATTAYLIAKRATDLLPAINAYEGENAEDKGLPAVIAMAMGPGEPAEGLEFTGNLWFDLQVSVRSTGAVDAGEADDDPRTAHNLLVAWVFDAMMMDDLATQLSASLTAFYCQAAIPGGMEFTVEENNVFNNTIRLRVYCNAKDL